MYRASDLPKLQLVKQLIGQGMRPGRLIPLSLQKLQKLRADSAESSGSDDLDDAVQVLLSCLAPGALPGAVRAYIDGLIQTQGLAHFVEEQLPAFNQAVGDAWADGRIGIHAEHHYTDAVLTGVQSCLPGCQATSTQQRVLLTTPPGEHHGLGLLGVQAALTLQGAQCYNLGTQTPVPDVVRAVNDWGITVLAISASVLLRPELARSYALALRRSLPKGCKIWVGGQGFASLNDAPVAGVKVFQSTALAVQAWNKLTKLAVQ